MKGVIFMKKYLKRFVKEEEGIETIEFVGLVAVAAILIGVVVQIGTKMNATAGKAKNKLDASMGEVDKMLDAQ
mgnify:CR=1 FL=1